MNECYENRRSDKTEQLQTTCSQKLHGEEGEEASFDLVLLVMLRNFQLRRLLGQECQFVSKMINDSGDMCSSGKTIDEHRDSVIGGTDEDNFEYLDVERIGHSAIQTNRSVSPKTSTPNCIRGGGISVRFDTTSTTLPDEDNSRCIILRSGLKGMGSAHFVR